VYFRRLPDIRTTFPQDQQSHQSGVHHQGSTPADAISAVAFVRPVQASSHLKEVIEATTQSKIDPAKEGRQVANAAVASPDIITNPILRSIIVGAVFFVVIPAFWVIIVTSAINFVLDTLNLPLLPNVPDPPFGPSAPLETVPAASAAEAETVLVDPVVPQTAKIASSPERVRRSGMLSHPVLRETNEPTLPTGRVEMDLPSDPVVPQTAQPAPSTAGVEIDPPSSDVVEHEPGITSATKSWSDATKDSLRFAPKRRGRDMSSLTSSSVQRPAGSPARGTSNEGQQSLGGGGRELRRTKAANADGESRHDQSSERGLS